MITDYKEALYILKSPNHTAERTDLQMRPFEEKEGRVFGALRDFHSSWLMYVDGEKHTALRKLVLNVLRAAPDLESEPVTEKLHVLLSQGSVDDEAVRTLAALWHRNFLGITEKQQGDVFKNSKGLLDFFFYDNLPPNGTLELEQDVERLTTWLHSEKFEEGRVLVNLVEAEAPTGTCLNVIIDSFEPVYCSLTSLLHMTTVELSSPTARMLAEEILRLYPPFRFINRVELPEAHAKTTIDLYSCNRDTTVFPDADNVSEDNSANSLAFGYGKHACPGGRASLRLLTDVATYLLAQKGPSRPVLEAGQVSIDKGLCKVEGLKLRCPHIR